MKHRMTSCTYARARTLLACLVVALIMMSGFSAYAFGGTSGTEDVEVASGNSELREAVSRLAQSIQGTDDAERVGNLWDCLTEIPMRTNDTDGMVADDADQDALAALEGQESSPSGLTRAFVLTARELGVPCDEERTETGDILVLVEIGGKQYECDVAQGVPGERPWEQRIAQNGEGESQSQESENPPAQTGVEENISTELSEPMQQREPELVPVTQKGLIEDEEKRESEEIAQARQKAQEESVASQRAAQSELQHKETALDSSSGQAATQTRADAALGTQDSEGATSTAAGQLEAQAQSAIVTYGVHCQTYGDLPSVSNGSVAGTTGQSKRLESFWVSLNKDNPVSGGIEYRAHVQKIGWQDFQANGARAGTTNQSKRLEAIQIRLTGEIAKQYHVYYRVHIQRIGWMDWASDGQKAGTEGMSRRMEAMQIVLVKNDESAPEQVAGIESVVSYAYVSNPGVTYCAHVQTYGWQDWQSNGAVAGTTGQSKRLEGIKAKLQSASELGSLQYCAHVQTYGWRGWSTDGELTGTTGESKRLEALRVRLTGELEKQFDVWYRVHVQTYGWMGWACNGNPAGTAGQSKRLEALQIMILPKYAAAPGSTDGSFRGPEPRRMILVGDSRTVGTYEAVNGDAGTDNVIIQKQDADGTQWLMRNGAGYSWFKDVAISRVDECVLRNSSIVIWLGVNDLVDWDFDVSILKYSDEAHYASLINQKASEWVAKGARVYYATVGPVGLTTGDNTFASNDPPGYGTSNDAIRNWNQRMAERLSSDVTVLDVYGELSTNYRTKEGLHYDDATSLRYYDFVSARVQ